MIITILQEKAPDKSEIIRKDLTNTLIACCDTSDYMNYQWGFMDKNDPEDITLISGLRTGMLFFRMHSTLLIMSICGYVH